MSNHAAQIESRNAILNEAGDSLVKARTLTAKRPIEAESLNDLAFAAASDGDVELASQAMGLAAARGWRVPMAQHAMFVAAANGGEWDIAIDRLIALWRTGRRDEPTLGDAQALLEVPAGRAAMVARMKADPRWSGQFLSWATTRIPAQTIALIVRDALAASVPISCDTIGQLGQGLLVAGQDSAVRAIWGGQCAKVAAASDDFGWHAADSTHGIFDWIMAPNRSYDWSFTGEGAQRALKATNPDPFPLSAAVRFALLDQGVHHVTFKEEGPLEPGLVKLQVQCIAPGGERTGLARFDGALRDQSFTVPENCGVQRYTLSLGRGSVSALQIGVD